MTTLSETQTHDEELVDADDAATPEESDAVAIEEGHDDEPGTTRPRPPIAWSRVVAYGVLPALALLLALGAGYFKWVVASSDDLARVRAESVRAASEDAIALLSYKAESVDKDLAAARERLTGDFKDAYTELTRRVVIPGAKERHITAAAKVTAAAPVSATANHAVVLLYVNQTVTIGEGAPTDTQPVIRVAVERVNGRWLVSHFDPV
ncbi:hypothetical protein [Mycobacterium sp. E1747]|uniref:hypothetical protein n=1 Tax=Mycobacterium sp. E1747 TaxID=1834128 RepID=UPI000B0061FF